MLIFYILLLISVVLFCIPFYIDDTWYLTLFSIVLLVFNLLLGFGAIRHSNNPTVKDYTELCDMYNYETSHDSIPFVMKSDLHDKCLSFNTILDDYDKCHNNMWIGIYYPELGENRKLMNFFDISKIK